MGTSPSDRTNSEKMGYIPNGKMKGRPEVVLHFRPVNSQIKMDQGFIQAANLIGSVFLS
jgi:hypothetical protein